ncbi:hypothetical protein PRUPE_2G243200 [Prunus persica]|uniref:Uncharacterized protein n=1 Tax=Prunus persica TaxID=3760 RepID=M5XJR9_PRUPE|nr:uncharacterized protein LOC18785340 [Prunus persica]ONI24491.1 hypothetical protein PRUPE_2G243200 [Prunus persica]
MAESRDDPEFYLPTHFLTDDVVLHNMDDNSFHQNGVGSVARFPTEFPYEFDSSDSNSALSSPVESVVGSTETESSDEEDFLSGLTRRLAQSSLQQTHQTQKLSVPNFNKDKPEWVMAGSPQSILSGIGSWSSNGSPTGPSSQVPSPPTTPFGAQNDTWDLIYAAAGQVARLKMTNGVEGATKFSNHSRGLLGPPRSPSPSSLPCVKNPAPGLCSNQSFNQPQHVRQNQVLNKPQCSAAWGKQGQLPWSAYQQQQQQIQSRGRSIPGYESGRCGHGVSIPQSAWPPLQVQQHQNQHPQRNNASVRPILPNGSNIKRECAGTGVFLPRRYSNPAPEPRKKAGCPTVLLPAKVVQALNLNFEDMNSQAPPRFNSGLAPDHEALLARRNALLAQQRLGGLRPEGPLNYEVRLPQEWTY